MAERQDRTAQGMLVLALLGVVVALDQTAKWWAWRHVSGTTINSGGDILVGQTVGAWYSGRITGALLDLMDFGLLSIAVSVLARYRVSNAVRVPGALMTGGWGSNLLDRLGIHYWTAPGSVRGVVDFIHIGGRYYNIADFFIIFCTPLFLLAVGYQGVRAAMRAGTAGTGPPPVHGRVRARMRMPVLVGACLVLAVALGAVNYGGLSAATRTPKHTPSRPYPGNREVPGRMVPAHPVAVIRSAVICPSRRKFPAGQPDEVSKPRVRIQH
jgi:lipoprotein signal peptidase